MKKQISGLDIIGNIAILKFPEGTKAGEKKQAARNILKTIKNAKTVLEKIEKVKGRLRTYKTKFLFGVRTKETIHNESGCSFKLNIDSCYFSPRLSNERLEIAKEIKKSENVLVMFAGVSPFSIVIAKFAKPKKVTSIELGKACCKYAKENIKLNRLNNLEIIQGDVKKVIPKLARKRIKFDKIIMPRPQLKETFLHEAFLVSKKGTKIFYYDFDRNPQDVFERINSVLEKEKKKIKVVKVKKAGEIAPYKYRFRVDFIILN